MKGWAWGVCFAVVCSVWSCDKQCEHRSGTYRASFHERDGTCGRMIEQVFTVNVQPVEPTPPCTGEIRYSEDNCEVTNVDITCPEEGIGPGVISITNGKYEWTEDGDVGTGTMQIVLWDTAPYNDRLICQSTYDVDIERL